MTCTLIKFNDNMLINLLKKLYRLIPKTLVFGIINPILLCLIKIEPKNFKQGPVTIVGMLRAASGLGKASRLTLKLLNDLKFKVTSFDITYLFTNKFLDIKLPPVANEEEGGIIIIQNNPIHLPIILFLLGARRLRHKKIIMYAAWELDTLPKNWVAPCKLAHEIWVPSYFTLHAFKKSVKHKIIKVVPHFIEKPTITNKTIAVSVPKNVVTITSICNLTAGFYRKNILDAINAFKNLPNKNAFFIIKITGIDGNEKYLKMLQNSAKDISNIAIIDTLMKEDEINNLINQSDIILSLHRSEGFGLVLAEAMWLAKPIVATGWSGNLTFLPKDCALYVDYKLIDVDDKQNIYKSSCKWAQPDLDDATKKLSMLIENKKLRHELGQKAYKHAQNYFNKENFTKWIADSWL